MNYDPAPNIVEHRFDNVSMHDVIIKYSFVLLMFMWRGINMQLIEPLVD